jgi:hypothetical protein
VVEDVGDAEVSSGQLTAFLIDLDDVLHFSFVGGENFENEG